MQLNKLNPENPYEKLVIEAEKFRERNPLAFYKEVQGILKEVHEGACKRIGIPIDIKFDNRLIVATTEDGAIFYTRADFVVYPKLDLGKYLGEVL